MQDGATELSRRPGPRLCPGRWVVRGALSVLSVLVGLAWASGLAGPAHAQAEPEPLRVVIKPLVPFVIVEENDYRGFSIDLWDELARRLDRPFEYQLVETVTEQIAAVVQGQADLAITGISITREREELADFSQPYFNAGLQVMTHADGRRHTVTPLTVIWALLRSPGFFTVLASLFGVIFVIAHIFWLAERRHNPEFPHPYLPGIWEGIWYTVVTMVTVGYGDRIVRSVPGRLMAMFWMFLSLFLVASFTAGITSQLTLDRIYSQVRGPEDLPGKAIATVAGSTSADYLDARRLPYTGLETIEEAYALLADGAVDAVVYDAPVLLYHVGGAGQGHVQVVGEIFDEQDYGILLPAGSPLREDVNRALLGVMEDGTYDAIYSRWFEVQR